MTSWFGAHKRFAQCRKRRACRAACVNAMSTKDLQAYMRRRRLAHSFVEKNDLMYFVAQVYGKSPTILTACVAASDANVWFLNTDGTFSHSYRFAGPYVV